MNVTIKGHHVEVTAPMREYAHEKLAKIKRHFDQVVEVVVTMSVEPLKNRGERQRVEGLVKVKGKELFAEHAAHDMYEAIDLMVDKLNRIVCEYKERTKVHSFASAKRGVG